MFRSRRSNLVRKLWKLQNEAETNINDPNQGPGRCQDAQRKSVTSMLQRLKEGQLESLVKAVETNGEDPGQCCPVPAQDRDLAPNLIMCQLFRWSNVSEADQMVRLPWCSSHCDIYVCCNPFHWSRVILSDTVPESYQVSGLSATSLPGHSQSTSVFTLSSSTTSPSSNISSSSSVPPPIYSSIDHGPHLEECIQLDISLEPGSLTTDGGSEIGDLTWCRLAYWEERSRVGHQVPISASAVQVFSHQSRPQPGTDAMCLESLFSLNYKPSLATVRTREKIGLGLIINKDEEGVWCHNRTHVPIFVNSPTLDVPNSRTFNVFKIPPGFSMQIFNFELSTVYKRMRDPSCYDGPFDPHSVRLSFAKGWGQNYSRQSVECCPCWLEILLLPPR